MDLTIYTYGHLDAMWYVLNGIAMLMNTRFTDMLITTISLVSTSYYGLKAVYAASGGGAKQHLIKVAGMIIVINSLLIPKASVTIKDNVTKQRDIVDNLPLGFALPVGFLETFGNTLTAGFEQVFSRPNSANYSDYGMIFGARLVRESRNWRVKTPEFVYNMNSFVRGCVIRGVARGKYSLSEIFTNENIWDTVSANASSLRQIEIRRGRDHDLMTCHDAVVKVLTPAFETEIDILVKKYTKKDFSLAGSTGNIFTPRGTHTARSFFKKNIETVFGEYIGSHASADSSLKQYMMLNSFGNYARDYGAARAAMNQETNWRIAGDLAEEYLPMLLSVIKGMVYASFIFMVPLMLMSGGVSKYLKYLTLVASLQLWPALNAILNIFIDLYSADSLQDMALGAISWTNYSSVGDYSDKIVAIASGLQMSVPFLAFALVQGGVSGFIHLAGSITGASNSAASMAASEVTSGNRNFDNQSMGNTQIAMNQGFKTDYNTSYKRGMHERQLDDGAMERVTGTGSMVYQSGAGLTSTTTDTSFNMTDGLNSHLSKSYTKESRDLESKQAAYHQSDRSSLDQAASMVVNLAKRDQENKSVDYSVFGEHSEAVQKAVSNAQTLNEKHGYGWDQLAQGSLGVDGKLQVNPLLAGVLGKGLGKGASKMLKMGPDVNITGEAKVVASNTSDQSFEDSSSLNVDQMTRDDWNNVIKAGMSADYAKSSSVDYNFSDNITKAYANQLEAQKSLLKQAERVESISDAMTIAESQDSSKSKNMTEDVIQETWKRYGGSVNEARKMVENGDPRVDKVWGDMVAKRAHSIVDNQIRAKQINMSDEAQTARIDRAHADYSSRVDKDYKDPIVEKAKSHGIDPNDPNFVKNDLEQKAKQVMEQNSKQYDEVAAQNQQAQTARQAQIDKYEKDRIGKGVTSKIVSLGTDIGGPTNPSTIKKGNDESAPQIPEKKEE